MQDRNPITFFATGSEFPDDLVKQLVRFEEVGTAVLNIFAEDEMQPFINKL